MKERGTEARIFWVFTLISFKLLLNNRNASHIQNTHTHTQFNPKGKKQTLNLKIEKINISTDIWNQFQIVHLEESYKNKMKCVSLFEDPDSGNPASEEELRQSGKHDYGVEMR